MYNEDLSRHLLKCKFYLKLSQSQTNKHSSTILRTKCKLKDVRISISIQAIVLVVMMLDMKYFQNYLFIHIKCTFNQIMSVILYSRGLL